MKLLKITDGNWLTDLSLWLILLMPLLAVVQISEPLSFGRYVTLMFVLAGLLIGVISLPKLTVAKVWWRQPLIWWLVAWLASTIISCVWGVNLWRSWWGSTSRANGLILIAGLALLIPALLLSVRQHFTWLKIFGVMSWVGLTSGVIALLQQTGVREILFLALPKSEGRSPALMGNPIFLGQLLIITIFLTIYFAVHSVGYKRWLYWVSVVIQLAAVIATASRGPLLGLMIGVVTYLVCLIAVYGWRWVKKWWAYLVGGGGVMIGLLLTAWWLYPQTIGRLFTLGSSFAARLVIWQVAWDAFKARPTFGYGLENARYAIAHFYRSGLGDISFSETIADRAHNIIFDQLLTNGVVGLIIMIGLVISIVAMLICRLRVASRTGDSPTIILCSSFIAMVIGYFAASLTGFETIPTLIYWAIIVAGLIFWLSSDVNQRVISNHWRWVVGLLVVGLLWLDLGYLRPAVSISRNVQLATIADRRQDSATARKFYGKATQTINPYRWPLLAEYPNFARRLAVTYISQGQTQYVEDIVVDGLRALDGLKQREPDLVSRFTAYPILFSAWSYVDSRYWVRAEETFNELVKEFPHHEYIYLNWARTLMGVERYQEAKTVLDKLSEMPSPPQELPFWRAFASIGLAVQKPGISLDEAIVDDLRQATNKNNHFVDYDLPLLRNVAVYLVDRKQYDIAVYYQEQIISLSSKDVQELSNVIAIYAELRRWDDVVKAAKQLVSIDPSKITQTQQYLEKIGRSL
ncbi:MAG: O-antigen ligase family protein [Patescibacteria group bacterium]|jgi:O-antigen ligase